MVKSTDFINALNHSIISSLCLVVVRANVRQAKFCLRMSQVFFFSRCCPEIHVVESSVEIRISCKRHDGTLSKTSMTLFQAGTATHEC